MANPAGLSDPNQDSPNGRNLLRYAGFFAGVNPPDATNSVDVGDGDSATAQGSDDSGSSDSVGDSNRMADLAACLRVFSESMLRMELAELELIKARETYRLEAEKRRFESEAELTQTMMQTQLQIAKFLSRSCTDRKRKRSDEDDSSTSLR